MTREQIEKAAEEYIHRDKTEGLTRKVAFIDGARWRIENAWHTDLKEAQRQRGFIVEFTNGRRGMFDDIRVLKGMEGLVRRYAYVDDLMPDGKLATGLHEANCRRFKKW